MTPDDDRDAVSTIAAQVVPPEGCPPPLRCRQVAENWHAVATPWSLPGSPLGTQGTVGGTGTPLYFLNAFGGCAELFTLTAWLLREDVRCVLLDWSAPTDRRRMTLDDFAADVLAVADLLGDQQLAVYGATFGAAVAARLAATHPDRVSSVILQGAWEQRRLSVGERLLAWWHRRSTQSLSTWAHRAEFQAANHRVWFPPLDPDRWAWFLETTGTIPLALMAAQARALDRVNLAADHARLACPTLLLATEGDGPTSLGVQQRIAAAHPRFRYEYQHSTGQHPYLTHPHRLVKLLKSQLLNGSGSTDAGGCCSTSGGDASAACCNGGEPQP
uniref:Alpha/beta hydrolase n=1 Tax=Schlesneria paludicola TaxID=360056 RepID=A0A7C2JZN4_9PLAN